MPSSEVLEATIRAAVVRTLTHSTQLKGGGARHELSVLDEYMWQLATRDMAFRCAIGVCEEDSLKQRSAAELLLIYVVAFSPSETILEKLLGVCARLHNPGDSACPFAALQKATETIRIQHHLNQYHHHTAATKDHNGPALTPVDVYRGVPDGARPVAHYLQQPPMQPPVRDRNQRPIAILVPSTKEWGAVAEEKNFPILERYPIRHAYHVARCKDYVDQRPLNCTEGLLEQQLKVLSTYYDNYRSNPFVSRATACLIKLWCDAYVAKLPLAMPLDATKIHQAPGWLVSPPMRLVTISFVPVLLKMMESEYYCVRCHVYDTMLTFQMHLQLMDSQRTFPHFSQVLVGEVSYVLCLLVRRQVVLEETDERLLNAALKCTLVTLRREDLCRLDHAALKAFLNLSGIAHEHPHIYVLLTEALAVKLLRPDGRWEGTLDHEAPNGGFDVVDEAFLAECGWSMDELLLVYLHCMSAASRLHMMCILFAVACHNVVAQSSRGGDRAVPGATLLARAAKALADLNLHWHLHSLVLYQSHRTLRELPTHISVDIGMKDTRDVKTLVVAAVQQLVHMVERFHTLPAAVRRGLAAVTASTDDAERGREALRKLCDECREGIPALLRDDTCTPSSSQRVVAVTLMVQTLRLCKPLFDAPQGGNASKNEDATTQLLRSVACSPHIKVRSVMPEVLGALWLLMRTQPSQAMAPFQVAIRLYLHSETNVPCLVRLAGYLMEGIATDWTFNPSLDGDISTLLIGGHKIAVQSSTEMLGTPVLWGLYWGLRRGLLLAAACRARLLILSLLSGTTSDGSGATSTAQMGMWSKVMSDPYPPAALIGAQRVIRISGLAAYDKYEAAISEAQRAADTSKLGNAYSMAVNIWERVEADTR